MASFHYIALNPEGKELKGIIDAPDEEAARVKLKDLKLSVVALNAAASAEPAAGKNKFSFEALDAKGKKVVGTVVSEDEVRAFGRLSSEYQLKVLTINSKPADELSKAYQELAGGKKKAQEKEVTEQQEQERQELLQKVDITMKRIDTFLKSYAEEMKDEEHGILQGYLNQLVRIKDSTNLEHIRSTCERMLEHVQQQELFMNEEKRTKESAQIKVETSELLIRLKQTGLAKEIDIVKSAHGWLNNPILRPLAQLLIKIFGTEDPEISGLRDEIKIINRQIGAYFKMLIFGKSKLVKQEAWQSIKTLFAKRKELSQKIKMLKLEKTKASGIETASDSGFFENVGVLLGWILALYLAAYIISYPLTIKQLPIPSLPDRFYFYKTEVIKTLTLFFFIAYIAVTIRNFWLKKALIGSLLILPAFLFGFLLIVINLI